MAVRKVELRLTTSGFDAATAALDKLSEKLDKISAKMDEISHKLMTPKIQVDGLDAADAKIDDLDAKLDRIGHKSVTARVKVNIDSKTLGANTSRVAGGIGGLLGRLFGGGGGGGGDIAADIGGDAASGGSSLGKDALSSLGGASNYLRGGAIGALIAAALSITPAILPFGLGAGVGLGGILAALKLTKRGQKSLTGLEDTGKNTLIGALTSDAEGPHGGTVPDTSFLSGVLGIMKQIGSFTKSLGPGLGDMFRASLPIIKTVVQVMEQFAKAVMPAITQSMKELKPYLPQIEQGFKFLSQGIADFIKDLGPGMRTSVTVFKALMDATKGILIALAYVADALAWTFARFGNNVRKTAHQVAEAWDVARHDIAAAFDWIVQRVRQDVDHITNDLDHWRHDIANTFDNIRHDIAAIWDEIWNNTVGRVERGVHDVEHWIGTLPGGIKGIFSRLPGEMVSIGIHILTGLLDGLKSAGGSVLSWIGGFVSSIPGKFMSLLGIHSPSTVMHNIGLNIGQGLALGMDNSAGLVNLSASRLARGIPGAFSMTNIGASAGRAAGFAGGSGAELIISAQGDELLKAIVRALRYEIKNNGGGNVQKHLGWGQV